MGHQGTHAAFQAGALGRLAGQVLQDRLGKLRGASAVPGADGGFEGGEQVGEWGERGGWHGGNSCGLLGFQGHLSNLLQELIHCGLHLRLVGLTLAQPVGQGAEGEVGEQVGHTGYGQRRAGSLGTAEADGVVVERGLESLPQVSDEPIQERDKLVAGGFRLAW